MSAVSRYGARKLTANVSSRPSTVSRRGVFGPKDSRVVNDSLERSGGVGLIRESTGLFEASEITASAEPGAGHATQRLLGTLLVAPMHDDVMA
jgi:hypothetical protein